MSHLIFVLLAPFGLLSLCWMLRLTWQRRHTGAGSLLGLMSVCVLWLLGSLFETVAPSAEAALRASQATYVVIPWVPVAWLHFALGFTGRQFCLRKPVVQVAVFSAVCTTALALTVPHHAWLWQEATVREVGSFYHVQFVFGPWFWVHSVVSWGVMTTGVVLILRAYYQSFKTYRRLSAWIAVGTVIPVAANLVYVFRLLPIERSFTTLAFAVSAVIFGYAVFRFRFLDLRPTARAVVMDHLHEGLLVLDPSGRLTDFNPAAERLLGGDLALGASLTEELRLLHAAMTDAAGEVQVRGADGLRTLAWRATHHGDPRRPSGRLLLLEDVTQRRRAELALHKALEDLQARNEELDAFAHMVAHDLKSPIHGIKGYAALLRDEGDDLPPALRAESLDVILRTANKMDAIVQELLTLAGVRHQTVTPAPLDMAAVVDEALERLAPLLRQHEAAVERPDAWPPALGHAPWVEAVWVNYVGNAAKYGGDAPRIRLGVDLHDDAVRCWVDDDGPGLSPEEQAQVFTPFTRFHPDEESGHGLGLAVVTRVLERLHGACGVETAPGGGCRFWFSLPPAREAAAEVAPAAAGEAPLRAKM